MNVCMVGAGYVGLVSGACFAEMAHHVICVDVDKDKINQLRRGQVPIYEPGLTELIGRNREAGRLEFSTELREAMSSSLFVFITVGTPSLADGSADLSAVYTVAEEIGKHMSSYTIVVDKSTVPVGTAHKVHEIIDTQLKRRGQGNMDFAVVSNPEFLKEGAAIKDFMHPDRIIIGADHAQATEQMKSLYAPLTKHGYLLLEMDVLSAELTKYATNSMLATRISFMNEIAAICERTGADIDKVQQGLGADPRIGPAFLSAGVGYGGSCFPKDVRSLIRTAADHELTLRIVSAAEEVNQRQKYILLDKLLQHFGSDLSDLTVAVWGLSFKPLTDDTRESPAVETVRHLRTYGAHIQAHDPVAIANARKVLGDEGITYCQDANTALVDADALLLFTEWPVYTELHLSKMKSLMKQALIFDGRNVYSQQQIASAGFMYEGIGRKKEHVR